MTRRRGRRWCASFATALALANVTLTLELPAFAQGNGAMPATPARRVVEVHVAGGGADAASLDETVRELLGRLTLVMESQSVARLDPDDTSFRSTARPSLLARVAIDLRASDVAVVTIVDGRTGGVTLRKTVRRDGPPAVVREELAHVIQSAIDPMVLADRDRANAAPPPPAPPPATAPPPPAPEPAPAPAPASVTTPDRDSGPPAPPSHAPLALDLATFAGAGSFASGAGVVARAGGGATLVYRRGVRPSVGIAAHYVFPFEAGSQVALAHVGVTSFRSMAGIQIYGSPAFAMDLAAGGGLDLLSVAPRSNVLPSDRLGAPATRVDPIGSAAMTGHLAIGAGTAISLMLATDVDFASHRWVIEGDGTRTEAFAPSRIRPLAMVGFTFTALGESRFTPKEPAR